MSTTPPPLAYVTPATYAARSGGVCPICNERPVSAKLLYGHPVCKKCLYRLANRRQFAYLIDVFAFAIPAVLILVAIERTVPLSDVAGFLVTLGVNTLQMLAFTFRDGFSGQSPGKRVTGVQVVDVDTGQPISFGQSFRRNWWFLLSLIPGVGGLVVFVFVIIALVQMNKGPRVGDRGARTRVIWKKHADSPVFGGPDIRCRQCGYDLTGNTSGTCPECGTPTGVPIADVAPTPA